MIDSVRDDSSLSLAVETFFRSTFSTENPLITEAVKRMLAAGGKRLRPRMTLLAAQACGGDPIEHLYLAAYMELIHVATLIHDDVVDNAQLRRGVNATAVDYGNRISVLAGDYLFAWIFKNVTANYEPPIPHILSATLADICDGEVLQLRALGDLSTNVAQYTEVAEKKTASLFAASAACGAIAAGGSREMVEHLRAFGRWYGIAFQMNDDLLDLTSDETSIGKPVGNDLRERKMTIPLICALERGERDFFDRISRFYAGSEGDLEIPAIVALIGEQGGLEATKRLLNAALDRAETELDALPSSTARTELRALVEPLR